MPMNSKGVFGVERGPSEGHLLDHAGGLWQICCWRMLGGFAAARFCVPAVDLLIGGQTPGLVSMVWDWEGGALIDFF